jgi:hypothetical protein
MGAISMFRVIFYKGWYYIRYNGCDYVSNAKGKPYGYSSYAEASGVCSHHNSPFA